MSWLPEDFIHPERVELATGHHLRPIREDDVEIDYPAVMGSRERLWERYGQDWGWPPATMTYEADKRDLLHHEQEIAAHETFNYAILDEQETELLGCVYIDPPDPGGAAGADVLVSWWVVDRMVGSELDRTLAEFVPTWLGAVWEFESVDYSP